MAAEHTAHASWHGDLMSGSGTFSLGSGAATDIELSWKARAERARDQLARQPSSRVLAVEDRVDLDHLERAGEARVGNELECEVCLAVRKAAAYRRSHPGCDLGIDDVHVQAHVYKAGAGDVLERLAH